jgi:hypothetical protein
VPTKAGQIIIDISAGTSKFVVDMENAKAKIRDFGKEAHGSVSGVQAVSASLRVLEGNMTNNLRAAERFVANVLHLGPVLQAAFPVVGAIAFAGVLGELVNKANEFFKQMQEGPRNIANAFREINEPLKLTNDGLALANARLDADIAKLEGHRENTLAIALLEAKEASDKLSDALEKNLAEIDKVLQKDGTAWYERALGKASTADTERIVNQLRDSQKLIDDNSSISDAEKRARTVRLYQATLDDLKAISARAPGVDVLGSALGTLSSGKFSLAFQDQGKENAALSLLRQNLEREITRIGLTGENIKKTSTKTGLEGNAENSALGRPFARIA